MSLMYCPKCKTNVETKKEDFRVGLAIILIIFTGGFGLLIYVAIYLDKAKNRCIHCDSECNIQLVRNQSNSNYQLVSNTNQIASQKTVQVTQLVDEKVKYCFSCGVELDSRDDAKFCRFCGTNIN
ncbi:MAG: hypothetical protein KGD65_15955 [Candidatus Lokiarchaeota archaeon]|nr:hypothetical protein [Candidatus Lokiarchaeota archaeon]